MPAVSPSEKAVRRFREEAQQDDREIQLHLPLKEVAAALQEGVGELMRQAGLELMQLIMEDEVRQLAGERCQRRQDEQGYRWGKERGFLVVDGQKAKIGRPRVRSADGHEQTLGSYELFCRRLARKLVAGKIRNQRTMLLRNPSMAKAAKLISV